MGLNTNPCHFIAADSDMAFSGSSSWDLTMAPGGLAGHSQRGTPFQPAVASFISFHNAEAASLFFLSHMTTSYLYIVVVPTDTWPNSWQAPGQHPLSVLCGMVANKCLWPACVLPGLYCRSVRQ